MKSTKDLKTINRVDSENSTRRAPKLSPIKKSGKEKHYLYEDLDNEDEDLDVEYKQRESVLDYYDDEEEDF